MRITKICLLIKIAVFIFLSSHQNIVECDISHHRPNFVLKKNGKTMAKIKLDNNLHQHKQLIKKLTEFKESLANIKKNNPFKWNFKSKFKDSLIII